MSSIEQTQEQIAALDIPLERDSFMRTLVRELANVLEDTVGIEQASGFISVVGQSMGAQINADYKAALNTANLTLEQVAAVLVNLKQRIQGEFYIESLDDEKIVLKTHSCPFAEKVIGQKAMCMMTSNVFGHITAENLGYAKVQLKNTIAEGAPECHVIIHLKMHEGTDAVNGREYFQSTQDV